MSADERIDKAGASFKALEKRVDELERKFELVKDPVKMRRKEMIEIYKWYLDRLMKEDEPAKK